MDPLEQMHGHIHPIHADHTLVGEAGLDIMDTAALTPSPRQLEICTKANKMPWLFSFLVKGGDARVILDHHRPKLVEQVTRVDAIKPSPLTRHPVCVFLGLERHAIRYWTHR